MMMSLGGTDIKFTFKLTATFGAQNNRKKKMKHPIQPLYLDEYGTIRFKANKIVEFLLDNGGIDMNKLARVGFSQEDRVQFAQLIGYSLGGFSSLSYVDDETYYAAEKVAKDGGLL